MIVDMYRDVTDYKILVMTPMGTDLKSILAQKDGNALNAENFEIFKRSIDITEEPRPKHEVEKIRQSITATGFYIQTGHVTIQIRI